MKCGKAERLLSSYIDERLEAAAREELEAHLDGCPGCQVQLRLLRVTSSGLARLGPAEPPPGLAQRALRNALAGRPAPAGWLERLFPIAVRTAAATAVAVAGLLIATRVAEPSASASVVDPVAEITSTSAAGLDDDAMVLLGGAEES